jgi:hypothetical protein
MISKYKLASIILASLTVLLLIGVGLFFAASINRMTGERFSLGEIIFLLVCILLPGFGFSIVLWRIGKNQEKES